jgi:hypothetical protein
MSYSISGSGHGANVESVKEAFRDLIEALDEATPDGGTKFTGTISGSEDGEPFSLTAQFVRDGEPEPEAEAPPAT